MVRHDESGNFRWNAQRSARYQQLRASRGMVGHCLWHGAFLYSNGKMVGLSLLAPITTSGWTDLKPVAINDHGQIAGYGNINGAEQAFLLSSPTGCPRTRSTRHALRRAWAAWIRRTFPNGRLVYSDLRICTNASSICFVATPTWFALACSMACFRCLTDSVICMC
jgi:hypothetical protein